MKRTALFLVVMIAILLTPVLAFAQDGEPIDFDQVVTGEITDENPQVLYSFIGGAGDTITVSMVSTFVPEVNGRAFDAYLYLRDSNGETLSSDDDGGTGLNPFLGPYVLPADGHYTVVADRFGGESNAGNIGTFELVVRKVEVPNLSVNETVTVELTDESPVAFFNFNPPANQVLSIIGNIVESDNTAAVSMAIRTPDGQFINQGYADVNVALVLEPVFTTSDRVIFALNREAGGGQSDVSGSVRFDFTARTIATQPLTLGTTINATLDDAAPSQFYTFEANAGDLLRLEGQQISGDATFEATLYSPNGFSLSGGSPAWSGGASFIVDPVEIDTTGQYMLMIRRFDRDRGPGAAAGQTVVADVTISTTQTPILEAGVAVEGTVGGDVYEQVFRFTGEAGQSVRVTLSGGSGYAPSVDVQGPTGNQTGNYVMNANSQYPGVLTFEFALPESGEYFFRVHNGAYSEQGANTGAFRLLVEVVQ